MKVVLLFVLAAIAAAANVFIEPHDPQSPIPDQEWKIVGRPNPKQAVKVHIGLAIRNAELLETLFLEVSNPKSSMYGKYLTNEEVTEKFSAEPAAVENAISWLVRSGVERSTISLVGNGALLTATMSVSLAENVFSSKMMLLQSLEKPDVVVIRSVSGYQIPEELVGTIMFVDGIHRLFNVKTTARLVSATAVSASGNWPDSCGSTCHGMITPAVLTTRYNITSPSASPLGTQSVAEFQGQDLAPSDLLQFQTVCKLAKDPVTKFVGPNQPVTGVESGLDIEYIMGVAQGVNTTFWSLSQYSLYDWIEQVAANSNPPLVHSVSYGNDEAQNGQAYMVKTNQEFAKMAIRGLTILFASGDQGVWGRSGVLVFHPDFPAASPYITSVGATQFPGANIETEHCTSWSGGGFSKAFEPLPFAVNATQGYIANAPGLPPHIFWNAKGNGYPVLSANGGALQPYCVIVGGTAQGVAGTSASCPTVAAMIALANSYRLAANKTPLGFVNQMIFQMLQEVPQAFDDVTVGRNSAGKVEGFSATKGWDPCSGVGNINFKAFNAYTLSI